ncbi:hypothetical protein [Erythrobacter sp. MTPC3]|uniref:hypothetical protein n=1 Tax=Erythrobacter sp. MTPC3 TaxID=3056564 RepID=UPI0036F2221B
MTSSAPASTIRPGAWAGGMFASLGIIAGLKFSGAIEPPAIYLLLIIPLVLSVQFYRSMQRSADNCGASSPAIKRYNRGIALASLAYVLGMGIAVAIWERTELTDGLVFLISLLPAIPTFAMIWVMGRYLTDEQDEYLRHRSIMASLAGLGLVLALGTFYGFLEMFGLVPHVWAWWILPIWAIGMGLFQYWQSWRSDR